MSLFSRFRQYRGFMLVSILIALTFLSSCTLGTRSISSIPTVDPGATDETKALFMKLWTLADSNQTLFGHQDDTYFGVGWRGESGRSDILEASESVDLGISGSYPAVYGWEIGSLEFGGPNNVDGVPFSTMRDEIIAGYRRGGVITISWHMTNPVTGENFYDRTSAASTILPGGSNHDMYRNWLDQFVQFDRSLTVSGVPWNEGEHLVPVVFRPFHEHNCRTFWWGRRNSTFPNENATEDEYIELWRFTVEYLRDIAGLHNLLYAYSPDTRCLDGRNSNNEFPDLDTFQTTYFYAYPGNEFVDVLGLDYYQNTYPYRRGVDDALYGLDRFQNTLDMLVETTNEYDAQHLKIPALTETGGQTWELPSADTWWIGFLYRGLIGTRSSGGQVAWALTWRNWDAENHDAPYAGSPSARDFAEFKDRPMIHFEDEIPFNLYTWP